MKTMKIEKECLAVRHAVAKSDRMRPDTTFMTLRVTGRNCVGSNQAVLVEIEALEPVEGDDVMMLSADVVKAVKKVMGKGKEVTIEESESGKLTIKGDGGTEVIDRFAALSALPFPEYEHFFAAHGEVLFSLGVEQLERIVKAAKEANVDTLRVRRAEAGQEKAAVEMNGTTREKRRFRSFIMPVREV